ncbi:MAG: hypothetical protein ACYC2H_01185 [Thermoplasmatota archaeon]
MMKTKAQPPNHTEPVMTTDATGELVVVDGEFSTTITFDNHDFAVYVYEHRGCGAEVWLALEDYGADLAREMQSTSLCIGAGPTRTAAMRDAMRSLATMSEGILFQLITEAR